MSLIFWDTNLFVYLLEGHTEFLPRVLGIWQNMEARGDELCTSSLTVGEALVAPFRKRDHEMAQAYRMHFGSPRIRILDFSWESSERYAELRAGTRIGRSDAIQLASAAQAGVDLFLTNDRALSKLNVDGIQFIASLDNCPI